MKRPIFVISLGFIIGILLGLYFNIAPFIFLSLILLALLLKKINYRSNKNYIRILKVFIKNNIILALLITAFISSTYLVYCNKKYEIIYDKFNSDEITAIIISNNKETEYMNTYKIKVTSLKYYKNVNFILRVSKSKNINLNYGDKIKINGEYIVPEESRNYKGFNYKEYLKTQNVYGIYQADKIQLLENKSLNFIDMFTNKVKLKIIENFENILPEDTQDLFLGILIGFDDNLSENIQESFRKSSLTHLLAVSGAHISYIITGLTFILIKLKIPKKISNIIISIFLVFFMYITDFSSSVVRASIMGIVLVVSLICFRRNDIKTSISISVLLILIENPYKILDIGLLLSYFATIGIIYFSKLKITNKEGVLQNIIKYIKEMIFITIYANIFVIPIMIYNFNTISLTFIISNVIAGILIEPITIGGFILIIFSFISIKITYIISIPYNLLLVILIKSTNLISSIPVSEIFISTPSIFLVLLYYVILFLITLYVFLKKEYLNRYIVKKVYKYIEQKIEYLKRNYKIIVVYILIFLIILTLILKIIPKGLTIYFIDVGQGDSTLIVTPSNKKILIDSGGSETGNFDVGKNTLVPYLLDRKIISLDYICISHFDSDHCDGFKYLLKNIKVKNIILSKQYESTGNFEEIMSIANEKNIKILKVEAGDVINIDKYVSFKIFSPDNVLTDDINDNSIVMKLEYDTFSCLFTGDISKKIEQKLVKQYGNTLKSTILKVAHHGSKTSSDENFIKTVKPLISLIGVGKNNNFGHPNEITLETLKNNNSKIYRTDFNGEIVLKINKKRADKCKYKIKINIKYLYTFTNYVNNI